MTIQELYDLALNHNAEDKELYIVDSNGNYAEVTEDRMIKLADGGLLVDTIAKQSKKGVGK